MKVLVTGSAGHLGEALVRALRSRGDAVVGLDLLPSPYTSHVGSITSPDLVERCMSGVDTVFHAATRHKPHVESHSRQDFVDTNITGTLTLLSAATRAGVRAFVLTSTTSVFGEALSPAAGTPAVWVTEELAPRPRNIYGVTKLAAEHLCRLARRDEGLACVVLRTSRFFPEPDDDPLVRAAFAADNVKLNEFLYRRVDIEDVVSAHLLAAARARDAGLGPFVISASTPFSREDLTHLTEDAPAIVAKVAGEFAPVYARLGWRMFPSIGRVYVNALARLDLGWAPIHDFGSMLARVDAGLPPASDLALRIGVKGYHRVRQANDSVIAE